MKTLTEIAIAPNAPPKSRRSFHHIDLGDLIACLHLLFHPSKKAYQRCSVDGVACSHASEFIAVLARFCKSEWRGGAGHHTPTVVNNCGVYGSV
jgi:hypothetical protein